MLTEKSAAKKQLFLFLFFTFIVAWCVFMLVPLLGLSYGSTASVLIVAAAMFAPSLGNVLTRLVTKEGFQNFLLAPRFKGQIRRYILLYFGPTLLLFLSGVVYFLLFPHQFDPALTALQEAAAAKLTALPVSTLLLVSVAQVVLIGPVINIIPTLGEELGWRGYLLPKLRLFCSDRWALVITGAIWGLWHLPVIVMGHNYGTAYSGYPFLGIMAMIVFCVSLGIFEGYCSIRMKSVIPAAMIHSLVNAGAALPIYMIQPGYNPILGPAITGLLGGIPFLILAVVLLIKSSGKKPAQALTAEE